MSGYLQQTATTSLDDAGLAAVLQAMVVGITGLDPTLVRPMWQPQPPTQPAATTSWCALGIPKYIAHDYPQWTQDSDTSGTMHRYERIDVHFVFYGPASSALAIQLRDGIYVPWNFGALEAQGLKLRSADEIVHLGEEINTQFIQRSDLPMSFVRMVEASYAIPSILSASIDFITDDGLSCTETVS